MRTSEKLKSVNKDCKMVAIDLSKQQALDVDPTAIQQD